MTYWMRRQTCTPLHEPQNWPPLVVFGASASPRMSTSTWSLPPQATKIPTPSASAERFLLMAPSAPRVPNEGGSLGGCFQTVRGNARVFGWEGASGGGDGAICSRGGDHARALGGRLGR